MKRSFTFADEQFTSALREVRRDAMNASNFPSQLRSIDPRWMVPQPWVVLSRSANQAHTVSGSFISVQWDTEVDAWDGDPIWSSGNPTVIELPTPGRYSVFASIHFAGAAGGNSRQIRVSHDADGVVKRTFIRHSGSTQSQLVSLGCFVKSDGTNFIVIQGAQDTGGTLNMAGDTEAFRAHVQYIGV